MTKTNRNILTALAIIAAAVTGGLVADTANVDTLNVAPTQTPAIIEVAAAPPGGVEPTRTYRCDFTLADPLLNIGCTLLSGTTPPQLTRTPPSVTQPPTNPPPTNPPPTQQPSSQPPTASAAPPFQTPIPGEVRPFFMGPFHLEVPGAMDNIYFSGGFIDLKSPTDLSILAAAKTHNPPMHVLVHLTGGRQNFQNDDKSFSLDKFKAELDLWRGANLQPYIDDGTIVGHLMIDEPQDTAGNWGGHAFPYADMEAAAAYSKSIWPNLPTGAGTNAVWASGAPFTWQAFDFVSTPYTLARGEVNSF